MTKATKSAEIFEAGIREDKTALARARVTAADVAETVRRTMATIAASKALLGRLLQ